MEKSEEEYLLELWERNICPQCGNEIPEGRKFGSGKKREGGFCSFNCYARYREADIIERQRQLLARFGRHDRG